MKSVDEMCEIMQASKTKEIESRVLEGCAVNYPEWKPCSHPLWDWNHYDYRVKAQEPRRVYVSNSGVAAAPGSEPLRIPAYDSVEFIELTPDVKSRLGLT